MSNEREDGVLWLTGTIFKQRRQIEELESVLKGYERVMLLMAEGLENNFTTASDTIRESILKLANDIKQRTKSSPSA